MKRRRWFPVWRLLKLPPLLLYALGLGPLYGRIVLLLTTIGRRTCQERVTPLQYEEIEGKYYIASARGTKADWYRNIVACPQVKVRVKARQFSGVGEPVTDPERIADFLEVRLQRHPRLVGGIMRLEGLPRQPTRSQLEEFSRAKAMVVISPRESEGTCPA